LVWAGSHWLFPYRYVLYRSQESRMWDSVPPRLSYTIMVGYI
jgi:hypothetical protein